jgi:hypothetical protein
MSFIEHSNQNRYSQYPDINNFLIKICQELNVFEKHYSLFKPIKYQNEYNEMLFATLISIKKYEIVEIYAKAQISTNSDKKYNSGYYTILKNLYKLQQKDDAFMNIALDSLLIDYDFETYLFVKNKRPQEFAKFKKDIYKNNYHVFNYSNANSELLYMKIFNEEKDFQAILKYMPDVRNLSTFNELFDELVKVNKTFFFYIVCRLDYIYSNKSADINKSIALINEFYTKEEVAHAITQMKSKPHGRIFKSVSNSE